MPRQTPASLLPSSARVTLPARITSLTAINRSSSVAAGLSDGHVAVWTCGANTAAVMLKPHTARVLAVGSTADGLAVWSVASDASLARTPITPPAQSTARRLDLGAAPTPAAAFSSDGSMLVTGGEFGEIRVFDTTSGALTQQLRGHRTELQYLAVRPGSAILASASAEADLRVWDTGTGREIGHVDGDLSLFALGFSPRDGTLASGGVNRRVTLHDPATFKPLNELTLQAPRMVATLAWSPVAASSRWVTSTTKRCRRAAYKSSLPAVARSSPASIRAMYLLMPWCLRVTGAWSSVSSAAICARGRWLPRSDREALLEFVIVTIRSPMNEGPLGLTTAIRRMKMRSPSLIRAASEAAKSAASDNGSCCLEPIADLLS